MTGRPTDGLSVPSKVLVALLFGVVEAFDRVMELKEKVSAKLKRKKQ